MSSDDLTSRSVSQSECLGQGWENFITERPHLVLQAICWVGKR
jgi:hypothetical protein